MSNTATTEAATSSSPWAVGLPHGQPWSWERIEKFFGDHLHWILQQDNPIFTCRSRATGAWDANDGNSYAAYTSLAKLLLTRV